MPLVGEIGAVMLTELLPVVFAVAKMLTELFPVAFAVAKMLTELFPVVFAVAKMPALPCRCLKAAFSRSTWLP